MHSLTWSSESLRHHLHRVNESHTRSVFATAFQERYRFREGAQRTHACSQMMAQESMSSDSGKLSPQSAGKAKQTPRAIGIDQDGRLGFEGPVEGVSS